MPVTVTTGSRLHFGMFSFGHSEVRQFGGVGAMIDAPGVRVRISDSDRFHVSGLLRRQASEAALRVWRGWGESAELPCAIEVLQAPPPHVGLGVGTQLALAVAMALHTYWNRPCPSAAELAQRAGRGRRSAIGLHGFWQGGLLAEGGKRRREQISPLLARAELPEAWRWVLVRPAGAGLSGGEEQAAFDALPPVPEELSAGLCREALLSLLPAAADGEFDEFGRSLYRFGRMAGECFASRQAGPYATKELADLVSAIRGQGVEGVGQTSWGPTLFALTRDEQDAQSLAQWLADHASGAAIEIARPLNRGAAKTQATLTPEG